MKAAIFDFDGVFTEESSGHNFFEFLMDRGYFDEKIFQRISQVVEKYHSGKLSYQASNKKTGDLLLKGLQGRKVEKIRSLGREFVSDYQLVDDSRQVVNYFNQKGFHTILISSSLVDIIRPFARRLEIDQVIAEELKSNGSRYEPQFKTDMRRKEDKRDSIKSLTGVDLDRSYGLGDSPVDRGFLRLLGHPIVINPRREMKEFAVEHDWKIYQDLTSFLQDIKQ